MDVHGPQARPGADVEYVLDIFPDGGKVKLVIAAEGQEMVAVTG